MAAFRITEFFTALKALQDQFVARGDVTAS